MIKCLCRSLTCRLAPASTTRYSPPIGGKRHIEFDDVVGFRVDHPVLWLGPTALPGLGREVHVAFTAPTRAAVVAFNDAPVAYGAEVLHAPRVWPKYHAAYYGAFVRDFDGNNVEVVCDAPA